jgi:hypothetical protein
MKTLWEALVALPCHGIFLGHCAKEATSALGWCNLGRFLGDFTIESKLLELREAQVAEVVVPKHELGLIVGSGKVNVFTFLKWR